MIDTGALIWTDQDDMRLGPESRELIDEAFARGALFASVFSFWEIAVLQQRAIVSMDLDVTVWRRDLIDAGLKEFPANGIVGVADDDMLQGDFFKVARAAVEIGKSLDTPRDRLVAEPPHLLGSLVVATANHTASILVTSDANLLAFDGLWDKRDARL